MNSSGMTNLFGNNEHEKNAEIQRQIGLSGKRRRGRNPADKEYRRLKRYIYSDRVFLQSGLEELPSIQFIKLVSFYVIRPKYNIYRACFDLTL